MVHILRIGQEIVDNCLLRAGESLPLEVIAVVRPRMSKVALQKGMNSGKSISGSRTDQKSIVARSSEMVLIVTELKFRPPGERVPPTEKGKEVYISPRSIKATTCCNVSGLYRFKPSQVSDLIMKKTGTYMLTLKIVRSFRPRHLSSYILPHVDMVLPTCL